MIEIPDYWESCDCEHCSKRKKGLPSNSSHMIESFGGFMKRYGKELKKSRI